jgi:hypothetical protein
MKVVDSLQMSAAVFRAELRARGFQIRGTRGRDVSGVCPRLRHHGRPTARANRTALARSLAR